MKKFNYSFNSLPTMTNTSNRIKDEDEDEHPTGTVILPNPTDINTTIEVPVVEARVFHKNKLTPDGLAAVLVPEDGEKRKSYVCLHLSPDEQIKIKKWFTVVASACEGHDQRTHLGSAMIEVLNVVPSSYGLEILINILGPEDIDYRAHVIIYY